MDPTEDSISVPRWVVYFQGALLGIVAATFFIFGLMVGSITSETSVKPLVKSCQVNGEVTYSTGGQTRPDSGAVVMLLPQSVDVPQRQNAELVNPKTFQPLDNPAIDMIHRLGGAVVRADGHGRFEIIVDSPAQFNLLVISKHQAKIGFEELDKAQMAGMSTYFIPVEQLLGDRAFVWRAVSTDGDRLELSSIHFVDR